ncbi:MAG: hypothetical protein ACYCTV_07195 [Leptospirales bacterium]
MARFQLRRTVFAYLMAFLFASVPVISAVSTPTPAQADPFPSVFGEFIPGSIDPNSTPYQTNMGWGVGAFWDVFVGSTVFFRAGIKAEDFVEPGIFLFPATIGIGARLTKGSPGDLYLVSDVGFAPSFYPGGASISPYYDAGLGYSFQRVFFEAKVAIIPNFNYVNGTLLYFPLTVGIHLF